MKRLRLVVAALLSAVWVATGCSEEPAAPDPLHYIDKSCTHVEVPLEDKLQKIAVTFFKTEVGVPVHDTDVGYVVLCSSVFRVPVTARTEMVPTKNLWFVEISANDFGVMKLVRPL